MRIKSHILSLLLFCPALLSQMKAQDGKIGYQFLNIPTSAHSAALGGGNISIVEDDATLMWTNAALLSNVSDKTISLGYTSYIASSNLLTAGFTKAIGERGTWAIGAEVLSYGSMDETDETGTKIGSFDANDIVVQTSYTYMLSDRWSGAITGKVISSNYGKYSSTALGADLALNYFDEDRGLSISTVGRNLGGQIDEFHDNAGRQALPFNWSMGFSKDFENAPIRFSLTADDITHWEDVNFIQHFIVGADILPSENTWIAIGYNFRRAHEMKVADKGHWAGFGIGAGLNTKKFKIGVGYGKYHVAASSITINAAFSL